ncbi:MAG: transaldolase [Chthonomonadales bacterium]|nr:transaldolase [Chthonomonadales bacterium]
MSSMTRTRIADELRAVAEDALAGRAPGQAQSDPAMARLRELGTDLWLDTGDLEEAAALWRSEFSALTTNNTLANQVVQTGILDDVVRQAVATLREDKPGIQPDELVMELGFVVNCRIALRLVKALGARVSVELHPAVAEDVERSVDYAVRYHAVCPERFTIKIPLTPEGYCAVARVRARGIPVNYTLGFSARQNYLAALVSKPVYCNVFLGRLNSVVADNRLGSGEHVGEKAAMATQNAICDLRGQGRTETRLIAASMRAASQVTELAGIDVFTMPPKVARAFMESHPDPASLKSRVGTDFQVAFDPTVDARRLEVLWSVDERVRALAEDLGRRNPLELTGDDLREADADHDAGLFHRYTSLEVVDIREHGKIPKWARWEHERGVPLDDLMTQSALQSFATDQAALDERLRQLALETA